MLTRRGWWLLLCIATVLSFGLLSRFPLLALTGLAMLFWFFWEWLLFAVRVSKLRNGLSVQRWISDERGSVNALWTAKTFTVRVELRSHGGRFLFAAVSDFVPFGVKWQSGGIASQGEIDSNTPLRLEYRIHCDRPGLARFEGLRSKTADIQGLFFHAGFIADPMALSILPRLADSEGRPASTKRFNLLPPPGVHRLRHPGSGSELLDLRDYMPGDPPRTIAW